MFDNAIVIGGRKKRRGQGGREGKGLVFGGRRCEEKNGRLNKIALANIPPPNPKPAFTIALEMAKSV
jgi:hypothetical protein